MASFFNQQPKKTAIETNTWGVTSARCPNKKFLTHIPSSTITTWHPSMEKSAFVGAVGSSTIHQGTWAESRPLVHWVIDIQTSIVAVDPAMECELTPPPLGCGLGAPGEHCLRQLPMDKRASVEVQESSREVPAQH